MIRPFKRPGRPSSTDDERVTALYLETRRELHSFLLRRCVTAEDAADCLAETYRVAWEKRARIPGGPEARAWLFGVARNAVRQERRRRERRAATSDALAAVGETFYMVTTPQDSALTEALAELSAVDREIVLMLSADRMSSREVASVLGLSPNAVRIRATRARQKLRGLLRPTEPDDAPGLPDASSVAVT